MTLATGIGSMPGDDAEAFLRATKLVLDELPDLPYLPELPGRGAVAGMTGRTLAVVTDLGVDLQPAGWRLTDAAGIDHRRARSLLAQDLDVLEEQAEGYTGSFKIQLAGPWTLAATVEKPRGDKVLSDHGARRELAQALAEGVRTHVRDVRRRLPGVDRLVVQVDEPALAAVLNAQVPTASGFGRHRTVHPPEASEQLAWVLAAVAEAGAEPWVHTCAPETPLQLLRGAGARGLAVDFDAALGGRPRRARRGARGRRDRRARHRAVHRDDATGRDPADRVGAALAGHARARPRHHPGPARAGPGLRSVRRVGGVGTPGAAAAAGCRGQPHRLTRTDRVR